MKYIDKDQVKAEIERRKNKWLAESRLIKKGRDVAMYAAGKSSAYAEFLAFLDTLPEQPVEKTSYDTQKYNPSPSVSIEDVARVQFASHAKVLDKKRKAVFDWEQFKEVASIFYGFGKKDSPETKGYEQPVEGLEEEVDEYVKKQWDMLTSTDSTKSIVRRIARHFAEWMKSKMMEEAVEGEVMMNAFHPHEPRITASYPNCPYKFGDKVRVIVIKEDEL